MLADLVKQRDQWAGFELMLPGIEPDEFYLPLVDPLFEIRFGLLKPLESLSDIQALQVPGRCDFKLTTQIGPDHLKEARLARAPGAADADDIRRPAPQDAMAHAPDQVIVAEGVFKYWLVVAAHPAYRVESAG